MSQSSTPTLRLQCPGCGRSMIAPAAAVGRQARCPACQTSVIISNNGAAPEPEAEPPAEAVPVPSHSTGHLTLSILLLILWGGYALMALIVGLLAIAASGRQASDMQMAGASMSGVMLQIVAFPTVFALDRVLRYIRDLLS
jgi:hypothetical protein